MAIFPERDIDLHILSLVIADYLETLDLDDLSSDTFLIWDFEFSDCFIFSSCFSFHPFEFFRFFDHFLGYESELSSLVSKHIRLIFVRLYLLVES